MFKHVIRKEPSEGSSSGSERDEADEALLDGSEGHEGQLGETSVMAEEEAAFWEENDEELPANLPSIQDALENPIFEAAADAKGRKTVSRSVTSLDACHCRLLACMQLICVLCPDKVLREGKMSETHLDSSVGLQLATDNAHK